MFIKKLVFYYFVSFHIPFYSNINNYFDDDLLKIRFLHSRRNNEIVRKKKELKIQFTIY